MNQGTVPWVVVALAPGGPAASAGVRLGDRVTALDGQPVPGVLQGEPGTKVRLSLRRGADSLEVGLTRRTLEGGHADRKLR